MRRGLLTLVAMLVPYVVSAQSVPPVTTGSDTARHTMVRAAGMPLNDGGLPPGMLTVRVVRGAFTADLPGVTVTADVAGGKSETARTGADGRAQFAHLPVGARVLVSAAVNTQQLTSESFVLPAESGVRILLVVDDGDAAASAALPADVSFAQAPSIPTAPPDAVDRTTRPRRGVSSGVLAIRIFFTIATLAAFAFVLFRQTTPRRRDTGTPAR